MTTTNKAFIDAYRASTSSTTRRPARPLRGEELTESFFGTSELVSATATSQPSVQTTDSISAVVSSASLPSLDTPRIDRPEGSVRRPLSAVQAEELFRFDPPISARCKPEWPESCQNLLAQSADRYDAVLRKLPSAAKAALVGIVGTAPRSGCTTTAMCLALRSSALGLASALVDGNLAHGGLASVLAVEQFQSWGELLSTSTSVATAIQSAEDVGVDLLLTGPLVDTALGATARFRASLAAGVLRRKYERVVIDLGCPAHTEACMVADLTAAMGVDFLIATATPATTAEDLHATSELLGRYGLKIAGVIQAV